MPWFFPVLVAFVCLLPYFNYLDSCWSLSPNSSPFTVGEELCCFRMPLPTTSHLKPQLFFSFSPCEAHLWASSMQLLMQSSKHVSPSLPACQLRQCIHAGLFSWMAEQPNPFVTQPKVKYMYFISGLFFFLKYIAQKCFSSFAWLSARTQNIGC